MSNRSMLLKLIRVVINPLRWIAILKSILFTLLYCENPSLERMIVVNATEFQVKIRKSSGSKIVLNGRLTFSDHFCNNSKSYIFIGKGARLEINGHLEIGPGVRIIVCDGATLKIGGRAKETASGFTENTKIMCRSSITIGSDLICAWNVFITDSDWHEIGGSRESLPVVIGNHVWITPNVSILKGSHIGDDSIVCNSAVVSKKSFADYSMIAGNPGKAIGKAATWVC